MLAHEDHSDRFQAVISLVRLDVSSILDLGCGIGSLSSLLADKFPSATILGLDRSRYLLHELRRRRMKSNVLLIRADAPILPLKPKSFDLVVAVQVLHEVLHFKGEQELLATLKGVYDLLKAGGELIVVDHRNPGETTISARLSKDLLKKLRCFKLKFKPRKISFKMLDIEWVRISLRDFYDFVTKIWALGTGLEEVELNETHTPFTEQQFSHLCRETGFKIAQAASLTSIEGHLKHYGIEIKTDSRLPRRHFIVLAEK